MLGQANFTAEIGDRHGGECFNEALKAAEIVVELRQLNLPPTDLLEQLSPLVLGLQPMNEGLAGATQRLRRQLDLVL